MVLKGSTHSVNTDQICSVRGVKDSQENLGFLILYSSSDEQIIAKGDYFQPSNSSIKAHTDEKLFNAIYGYYF